MLFFRHFFSPCSDIDHTHPTYYESSSLQAAVWEMSPRFSPEQMSLLGGGGGGGGGTERVAEIEPIRTVES